ncbi:hypothetical protein DAKH74_027570 [Maudiozyma humilis]|uniref:NADP-dependent oxidoreductase domain-containing protein n=1 Tax=Maudiozyma humilis TaxID=51915 RepID=A0AAV5RZF0_MAUHU|nr:hypothetical protein DAKH74_027570 [Kazachstania humilis]
MSPSVPLKTLNNGATIPELALGLWETTNAECSRVVEDALDVGYRHFDSAQHYGNEKGASEGIAKWLSEDPANRRREDIFYTTKITEVNHGYEKAKASIKESLKKAESIKYIDLVLIHSPMSNREKRLETWKALQEAVNEGTVKSIGVSNYAIPHLKELLEWEGLTIKPVINQVEINPWLTRKEIVDFCHAHGMEVEAYCPLTRCKKFDDPIVVKLSKTYGKTPAQILIKWSLQKGFIALPKTTHKERMASNLDVYDFTISSEDMNELTHDSEYQVICDWDPTVYRG